MNILSQKDGCNIGAWGILEASWDDIARLRKNPGAYSGPTYPPTHVKMADEQSVAGVAATLQTIQKAGWQNRSFTNWGVVASPCYMGRLRSIQAIARYRKGGARSVSPWVIPHGSLHSPPGTVSMALGAHGPNFGVSGCTSQVSESLFAGYSVMSMNDLPGTWVVITGFETEPLGDENGKPTTPFNLFAVALALVPDHEPAELRLEWSNQNRKTTELATLMDLMGFLKGQQPLWNCSFEGAGGLDIIRSAASQKKAG